jgi:excisionase family DNA binding protein
METNNVVIDQIRDLLKETDNIPQWYSIKDCVRVSGLSESSIRRAIRDRALTANKVGSKWLIKAVWLEEYLTS